MKTKTLFAAMLAAGCCLAQETVPAAKLMPAPAAKAAAEAPAEKAAIATKGAVLGQWTMDAEAALALAKKEGKPVFLNFTGSDWCGWCKLMENKVFSKPTWQAYTKENLVLVWVDFPRNKQLVPEEIVPKNKELAKQYGIQGYPTYVLLSPEGKEIGRLGADRDATPEGFIEDVEGVLVLQRMDKLLSAEDLAVYNSLMTQKKELEEKIEAWQEKLRKEGEAFQTTFTSLENRLEVYKKKAIEASKK